MPSLVQIIACRMFFHGNNNGELGPTGVWHLNHIIIELHDLVPIPDLNSTSTKV